MSSEEWEYARLNYPTGFIKVRYKMIGKKLIIQQNRPPFEEWGKNYNASVTNRIRKIISLSSSEGSPS